MHRLWVGALVLIGTGAMATAETKVELQYSQGVTAEQVARLNQDLLLLDTVSYKDSDGELTRLYKLSELSNESMRQWLAARAHYVVDQAHPLDASSILVMGVNVSYPNASELPGLGGNKISNLDDEKAQQQGGAQVVMSNIGGILYFFGKQNKALMGINLQGIGEVIVKSPRVGMFRIGDGLFAPLSKSLTDINDRIHSFFRLGTLFHESRHSDGHGKTMLFAHAVCPMGHDYAGLPACDTPANGPYRLEALFLKAVKEGCADCSAKESEILSLLQLDSESRVLSATAPGQAPVVDDSNAQLCGFMQKLGLNPDFCQASGQAGTVVEWDDEPESL
jgi:hypothetical protein